jgi:hypothetical protein
LPLTNDQPPVNLVRSSNLVPKRELTGESNLEQASIRFGACAPVTGIGKLFDEFTDTKGKAQP